MLTKMVIDCSTGEETIVPLTDEEIAEREKQHAAFEAKIAAREAEEKRLADLKTSALAKLSALGLTEEEAAAIAG